MPRKRRPARKTWQRIRQRIWERDGGRCQGPYCRDGQPISLERAHIDHITPLARGGRHDDANLRVLCRRCHVLRADSAHRGMIAAALRDGVIPADWRSLVWSEFPKAGPMSFHNGDSNAPSAETT